MISLSKIVSSCLKPFAYGGGEGQDRLLWCQDLGRHSTGEFSMAAVQANSLMEDGSQIESGPLSYNPSMVGPSGTFVGVYDGHGGPETSRYIGENLFAHLKRFTSEQRGMSKEVIQKAFLATEEGFLSIVRKQFLIKPQLAAVGSCCLVGVICSGTLYIANAGDSRAVLGRFERGIREVNAVQLSAEHNACHETVRDELRSLHPDDSKIVVLKHRVWRVKGIIQEFWTPSYRRFNIFAPSFMKVSRSIGDAYLKLTEFNREPLLARFRLSEPFYKSILKAEPSIVTHELCPQDQFVIFASDGLWEHLSNQEAVEIVQNHPHNGIARRLIKIALEEAAKKREMRYSDLRKIDRGIRRHFHDDITVIVLFLDPTLISNNSNHGPMLSLKGCISTSSKKF